MLPRVPVDEYLSKTSRPDREYIDGVLVERNVGTRAHSLLQSLLVLHFGQFRKKYGYAILTEARTVSVPRSRYRIPDVMLVESPMPNSKVVDETPLAVFEVLSPDDTMREQLQRFREYEKLGVVNMILLDPEERRAYSFREGALQEVQLISLSIGGNEIPFDTVELFRQFDEEYGE